MAAYNPTATLADADSYFASRLRSEPWDDATESDKRKALAQAAIVISGAFSFTTSAFEVDETTGAATWDARVIAAVCEEAFWLLTRNPDEIPESLFLGIASASAGGASVTFDKSFVLSWLCPAAKTLIGDLGTLIDGDESSVKTTLLAM